MVLQMLYLKTLENHSGHYVFHSPCKYYCEYYWEIAVSILTTAYNFAVDCKWIKLIKMEPNSDLQLKLETFSEQKPKR